MTTLLTVLFWFAVVAGCLALWGFVFGRTFQLRPRPDAVYFVETEDAWRLALSRYRPQTPLADAPPVVLCPGVALSGAVFDLSAESSLARYLARHGHDVWVLDLRGRGLSDKPRLGGRRRYRWSFDDYVDFDLPAAVAEVLTRTGANQVQWIGFDQGALALWGALSTPLAARVRSLVALAAPLYFKRQGHLLSPLLLRLAGWLPLPALVRLASPLLGRLYAPPLNLLLNRDNVEGPALRRALVSAVCALSRKELAQYRDWLELDSLRAVDQQRDYRKGLPAITTPTLLIYGPRDPLTPPEAMENTLEALSGVEDKVRVLASRMNGMSANYGHWDLLLGRNAPRDIFPHLLRWLDLQAGIELSGRPEPPTAPEHAALGHWESPRAGRPGQAPAAAAQADRTSPAGPAAAATTAQEAAEEQAAEENTSPPGEEDDDDLDWLLSGDVPRQS